MSTLAPRALSGQTPGRRHIRDIIRERIQETESGATVEEITHNIAKSLTPQERSEWFAFLLRTHVFNVIETIRNSRVSESAPTDREAITAVPGQHASPRVAAAASWWSRVLAGTYSVDGTLRRLGDLDVEAIERLAAARYQHAEDTRKRADRLARLAKALRDKGLTTAADLDEADAIEAWGESE